MKVTGSVGVAGPEFRLLEDAGPNQQVAEPSSASQDTSVHRGKGTSVIFTIAVGALLILLGGTGAFAAETFFGPPDCQITDREGKPLTGLGPARYTSRRVLPRRRT